MPTGYTAELCDRDVPFEKFVLRCARAFGALVEMRDDPHDAPIRRLTPSDHHANESKAAHVKLARLEKMKPVEAEHEAAKEFRRRESDYENHAREVAAVRNRLTAMCEKVAAWKPPTKDHEGLKKFMLEQIDSTIEYDGTPHESSFKRQSGKEWLATQIEIAKRDIEYHTEQYEGEVERTKERNAWVDALRESLKGAKK